MASQTDFTVRHRVEKGDELVSEIIVSKKYEVPGVRFIPAIIIP
jgi:hypothetical protein